MVYARTCATIFHKFSPPLHKTKRNIMTKDLFDKYIWLVDTIHRAGRITLREINEKWAMSPLYDGADIPRRTFNNWKEAIQQAFDINIECRRTGGYHYYIENPEDLENSTTRSWLLNTFTVKNIISESRGIRDRILLENVPSGQKHLTPIIDAMQANKWIEIVHGSYWYDKPGTYTVQPWCLKLFSQRWYVCGYCRERDAMRTFALDRIFGLIVLDETFEYPEDFDPQGYFADFCGISINNDSPITTIRIRAYGIQVRYLRSLPLHHSQKEVMTDLDGEWAIFEYRIRPTWDLTSNILSRINQVEVLSPASLREEIINHINEMAARYQNNTHCKENTIFAE